MNTRCAILKQRKQRGRGPFKNTDKSIHETFVFPFIFQNHVAIVSCSLELTDLGGKDHRTLERQEIASVIYSKPWECSSAHGDTCQWSTAHATLQRRLGGGPGGGTLTQPAGMRKMDLDFKDLNLSPGSFSI